MTTDGQQFIEAYDGFKPTTIILDMIMPGMDGNEIVLWLAQQKCTARLIIITGYTADYACQPAGGLQRTRAGDNIVTSRSKSASFEPCWARKILLSLARQENQGRGPTAWRDSMGEYERFALLVFLISVRCRLSAPLPGARREPLTEEAGEAVPELQPRALSGGGERRGEGEGLGRAGGRRFEGGGGGGGGAGSRPDAAVADFLDSSEYRKLYSDWYAAAPSFWTAGRTDGLPGRPWLFCCWACSSGSLFRCAPRTAGLPRAPQENCQGNARLPRPRSRDLRMRVHRTRARPRCPARLGFGSPALKTVCRG